MMNPIVLAIAVVGVLVATIFTMGLFAPDRLGGRFILLVGSVYCAAVEIDVESLLGASADRGADLALAGLAIGGFVLLFLTGPRSGMAVSWPTIWFGGLLIAGLSLAPLSLAPLATVQRSVVAIAVVASVVLLVQRHGFVHVLAAVVLGGLVVAAVSIGWELIGPGTPEAETTNAIDSGFAGLERHRGLTSQPNQFGRLTATLVIGGVVLSVHRTPYVILGFAAQAVGVVGLYLAQSRTAIVVTLLVVLATLLRSGHLLLVSGILVAGLATTLWLSSTGTVGVDTVTRQGAGTEELSTATGRTSLWLITVDLALDRPVTGVGAYATEQALAPAVEDGRIGFEAADAHNIFLNTFLAQGIVGVFFLLGLIGSALRRLVEGSAELGTGSIMALIAGLSMMENLLWKPNSTLVLLAVALVGTETIRSSMATKADRVRVAGRQ